jgi:hypothetical protein
MGSAAQLKQNLYRMLHYYLKRQAQDETMVMPIALECMKEEDGLGCSYRHTLELLVQPLFT